jgi:four helix bundle protein
VAEPAPPAAASTPAEIPPAIQLSGYRGLKVWQRAMDLAAAIYHATRGIADGAFADELWRTAISIPTSIAAGNSLYVRAEYVGLLSTAHGQVARLECLLHLGDRLAALPGTDTAPLLASASDVGRMLRGLAKALQPKAEAEATETAA